LVNLNSELLIRRKIKVILLVKFGVPACRGTQAGWSFCGEENAAKSIGRHRLADGAARKLQIPTKNKRHESLR